MRKNCSLAWASSSVSLDNAPLEFRIHHFQLPRPPVTAQSQGIASELLRRSAWKTAFPSAQPGITKTVRALAFSSIFFRRRPARLFSATSTGPKTSCSLLSSRNGNHAAGFVGDECDDPVERGDTLLSVRGEAMVSHASAKCRRSVAYYCSSPSKVDPSSVARMPQPNQKER
jgi:hypothetical protein